jgi:uncharacterized protein YcgI (DUF1989 family)
MHLVQVDVTGSRLIGAMTKELGMDGPKHYAVVLGQGLFDGLIYIAELMTHGCQVTTYDDFCRRYTRHGAIRLEPNTGPYSNAQVAQNALAEIRQGGSRYDLIVNNCESFVNRAMGGDSTSSQVVNTALGAAFVAGLYYFLRNVK